MDQSLILAGAVIAVGAAWVLPRLLGSRRRESSSVPGASVDGGFDPIYAGDSGGSDNDRNCADAGAGADADCSDSGSDGGGGDGGGGGD